MSLFHLAAVVVATPLPSPQVIKETLQPLVTNTTIGVTPPAVLQLAQLLGLAIAGGLTSLIHMLVERGKWAPNVNRMIWGLYSVAGGAVFAALTHTFGAHAQELVTALVGVMGMGMSSALFNNVIKFVIQVFQNAKTDPTPPAAA